MAWRNKISKYCIFSLLVSLHSQYVFAQNQNLYLVQKIEIKGIPDNITYTSILQDKKGFIWIGTLNGLYRYDGFITTPYLNKPSDTTSLSHNYVQSLARDEQGNIWAGTYGAGLNKFNLSKSSFERISTLATGEETTLIIKSYYSVKNKCLVFATPNVVILLSLEAKLLNKFNLPLPNSPANSIRDIIEVNANKILVVSGQGLFLIDIAKNNVQKLNPTKKESYKTINASYSCLMKDYNGNIWVGSNSGIEVLDTVFFQSINHKYPLLNENIYSASITKMITDTDNNIWVAYNNKISMLNPDANSFYQLPDSIPNTNDILQDKQGTIWVATAKQGLYRVTKPEIQFDILKGLDWFSKKETLSNLFVETDSTWLITTEFNLVRYYIKSGRLETLDIKTKNPKPGFISILSDSKKNYWISTREEGVFRIRAGTNTAEPIPLLMSDLITPAPGFVLDFDEDKNENIIAAIFGTNSHSTGLYIYNSSTKRFEQVSADQKESLFFVPSTLSQVQLANDDNIWAGTWNGGLFHISYTNKNLRIQKNLSIKSPLKYRTTLNIVSSVITDRDGHVWFGTVGGGLNCYYPKEDSIEYFTVAEGLPSNLIYRIEEDMHGLIWISTDNGISRYDKKLKRFINYGKSSGLAKTNFTFLSSLKTKNGTIAFGTNDGNLVSFNSSQLQNETNILPVVITEIRLANKVLLVSDKSVLKQAPYFTDTLRLRHSQSSVISFFISNMNFIESETYLFAYKLEGFDKSWTNIKDRNFITYTNLNPGTYTLLLKNANHLGVWNETPTKFTLIILPPWYRTWWFLSLVIFAVTAAIYILFRYRLHQKLKLYSVRQRIHRDLHDDVGATLSSVKAYAEILKENPDNPVVADLIKDNSTEMIERLEVIAWATNPMHDNFLSLKNMMQKFATPLCHAKKITFTFDDSSMNDSIQVPGEIRQNIFLVFKEAINNMIKYAAASACQTRIVIKNNLFKMEIADNGKGIAGPVTGSGYGLDSMKKRTEELKGKFELGSTPGKGTIISMGIPYPFRIPNTWDKNKGY